MHVCEVCGKGLTTILGLNGHKKIHSSKPKKEKVTCCCVYTRQVVTVGYLEKFQSKLRECKCCGYKILKNKSFCNSSCSAKYNNIKRTQEGFTLSKESRDKISRTLKKTRYNNTGRNCRLRFDISEDTIYSKISRRNCVQCGSLFITGKTTRFCKKCVSHTHISRVRCKFDIPVDTIYSKVYYCNCGHCDTRFTARQKTKFCGKCNIKYTPEYRSRYKFTFNVYKYPDLFDIDYIKEVGWYSRGGKAGEWNPDGLSRDHRVSVSAAIKNDYEPYYIKHPINCAIMKMTDNNKKKARCSISYEQLVAEVNEYDMRQHNLK